MRTIGNIIWFILGGFAVGLLWWLIGLLCFISVIGIPWGRSCFVIGNLSFAPFGRDAIARDELTHKEDIGTGFLGGLGNIVWFIFAGVWLAILHVVMALGFFVSLIGIPFAIQHLKLAGLSLTPVGKTIVSVEMADEARRHTARTDLAKIRDERQS